MSLYKCFLVLRTCWHPLLVQRGVSASPLLSVEASPVTVLKVLPPSFMQGFPALLLEEAGND